MLRVDCDPASIALGADGRMVVEPRAGVEVTARRFLAGGSEERYRIELEESGRRWRFESHSHLDAQKAFRMALTEATAFREIADEEVPA